MPALVNTDRDGRFEFAPRLESSTVVVASPSGFAQTTVAELAARGRITLQSWGRIEGSLRFTNKPSNGWWVAVHTPPHTPAETNRLIPALSFYQRTRPDSRGRFYFDRVPPGAWRVSLLHRANDYGPETLPFSHGQTVRMLSSQTNRVDFEETGRSVTGRVQIIAGDPGDVDWLRDAHYLTLQVAGAPDTTPPDLSKANSEAERLKLMKDFAGRQKAFWSSAKGRAVTEAQRQYALIFDTNGGFRVDGVPPGVYTLNITPTDTTYDNQPFLPLGSVQQKVSVTAPESAGQVLDLGLIKLAIRPIVRPGEPAPVLNLKTFDGQAVTLDSFRGKYLLVDFWNTATIGRSYDLEMIQTLFSDEEFTNRIAIVSLNHDRQRTSAEAFARTSPTPGPQCYLGPLAETKVPAAFGLEEQSSGVVILDPEGRIASKPLRSDYIRSTLRRLASPPGKR